MRKENIERAAALFIGLRETMARIDALPADLRPASTGQGYAIQDAYCRAREAAGDRLAGWKVAATATEAREMLGIDEPFSGRIFASALHRSPHRLSAASLHGIGLEGEFAFHMGADLPPRGTAYREEEVADAVARLHPAIEIVSPRFAEWLSAGAANIIADNASNGCLVIGPGRADWRDLDLEASTVAMSVDAKVIQQGPGRLTLGGPLKALTWLANHLGERGLTLAREAIVTSGTCTGIAFVEAGAEVAAIFGDLEEVRITVGA